MQQRTYTSIWSWRNGAQPHSKLDQAAVEQEVRNGGSSDGVVFSDAGVWGFLDQSKLWRMPELSIMVGPPLV